MTVDEFCKWIERLEHPLYDIPRVLKKEKRYAFFNLAFGDFPGRMNFLTVFCLSW